MVRAPCSGLYMEPYRERGINKTVWRHILRS